MGNKDVSVEYGKWSKNGNKLTVKADNPSGDGIDIDNGTIKKLTNTELILSAGGMELSFTRVDDDAIEEYLWLLLWGLDFDIYSKTKVVITKYLFWICHSRRGLGLGDYFFAKNKEKGMGWDGGGETSAAAVDFAVFGVDIDILVCQSKTYFSCHFENFIWKPVGKTAICEVHCFVDKYTIGLHFTVGKSEHLLMLLQ